MAEWLEQVSQWHEVYCHDLKVMGSNPGWVELGVRSTSIPSCTWTKNIWFPSCHSAMVLLFSILYSTPAKTLLFYLHPSILNHSHSLSILKHPGHCNGIQITFLICPLFRFHFFCYGLRVTALCILIIPGLLLDCMMGKWTIWCTCMLYYFASIYALCFVSFTFCLLWPTRDTLMYSPNIRLVSWSYDMMEK